MADDDRDKMEAALALMGMGSSLIHSPPGPSAVQPPPNPAPTRSGSTRGGRGSKTKKGAKQQKQQQSADRTQNAMDSSVSNGGFKPSKPAAHIPVPSIPHPRLGIAEAKIPAAPKGSSPIETSGPSVPRRGVLPKVSKNMLLRSKLENRIQAKEAAAQERENIQNMMDAARDVQTPSTSETTTKPVPAKRRKKQSAKTAGGSQSKHPSSSAASGSTNPNHHVNLPETSLTMNQQRQSAVQAAATPTSKPPVTYTLNAIHKYIDPSSTTNEVKKPGEFSSTNVAKSADNTGGNLSAVVSNAQQSISPALSYLGNSQQRMSVGNTNNSEANAISQQAPKIEQLASLAAMQRVSSTLMLPTMYSQAVTSFMQSNAAAQNMIAAAAAGNIPVLGHVSPAVTSLQGQGIVTSRDMSGGSTSQGIVRGSDAVIGGKGDKPMLRLTIPTSKGLTATAKTPLAPVAYSPISPADNLTLAGAATPRYTTISPPTVVSSMDQSEPLDLSKDTAVSKIPTPRTPLDMKSRTMGPLIPQSGKMLASSLPIFNEEKFQLLMKDGKLTCVDRESGISKVIGNPSSLGIQVITDPKSGQTLFIPNPKIQELERQESKSPGALSRQNSELLAGYQTGHENVPKSPSEDSNESKSPEPMSPPKSIRSQRTLPPKKRKFVDQSEPEAPSIPTVLISPKSLGSTGSSISDEGYGTLNENIVIPSAAAVNMSNTSTLSASTARGTTASSLNKPVMIAYPLLTSPYTAISLAQVRLIQSSAANVTSAKPGAGAQTTNIMSGARPVFLNTESMKPIPLANPLPQITPLKPVAVAHSLPANLDRIASSPPVTPKTTSQNDSTVHDLYAHKLFEEYKRSLEEVSFVKPGKSPFQHFRPSKLRSAATKASVDLTTSSSWSSKVGTKMHPSSSAAGFSPVLSHVKPEAPRMVSPALVKSSAAGGEFSSSRGSHQSKEATAKKDALQVSMTGEKTMVVKDIPELPPVSHRSPNRPTLTDTNTDPQPTIAQSKAPESFPEAVAMDTNEDQSEHEDIEGGVANEEAATVEEPISEELRESCKKAGIADEEGDLPIHIAVVHENLEAVDKLIYMMQIADIPIDHCNNDRQTPLHLAVITQNEAILSSLLQAGSNPNIADRKGCTGIHLAVKHNCKESLMAIMKESSIQPDLNAKNYDGYTALHMAVLHRQPEFVQVLLLAGANKDLQDNKSGRTALFHAAETKQFNIASALLQKGASVNIPSYAGTSPAQAANGRGHSDLVALLIKYGADVSSTIRENESPKILYPPIKAASSTVKSAVKESLHTRRRLQRMNSTNELASPPHKSNSRMRTKQQQPAQAQSLDFDLDLSSNALANRRRRAGERTIQQLALPFLQQQQNKMAPALPGLPPETGSNPLRIVLPDQGGIAASMPLSPSALGLATRKTLPMIPPMQAKSLPDDVAIPTPSTADETMGEIGSSTSGKIGKDETSQPGDGTHAESPKSDVMEISPVQKSPVNVVQSGSSLSARRSTQPEVNQSKSLSMQENPFSNEAAMQMRSRIEAAPLNVSPTMRRLQHESTSAGGLKRTASESSLTKSTGEFVLPSKLPPQSTNSLSSNTTVMLDQFGNPVTSPKSDERPMIKRPSFGRQLSDEAIRYDREPKKRKLESPSEGSPKAPMAKSSNASPDGGATGNKNEGMNLTLKLKLSDKGGGVNQRESETSASSPLAKGQDKRSPTQSPKSARSPVFPPKHLNTLRSLSLQEPKINSIHKQRNLSVPSSLPLSSPTSDIRRTASLKVPSSLPLNKFPTSPLLPSPSTPLTPDNMALTKSPTVIKKLALCPKTGDLIAQEIAPGGTDPELEKVAIPLGPEVAMQKALMSPGSLSAFPPMFPSPTTGPPMKLPSPAEVRAISERVISTLKGSKSPSLHMDSPSLSPALKVPHVLTSIARGQLLPPQAPPPPPTNKMTSPRKSPLAMAGEKAVTGKLKASKSISPTEKQVLTIKETSKSTVVGVVPVSAVEKTTGLGFIPSVNVGITSVSSIDSKVVKMDMLSNLPGTIIKSTPLNAKKDIDDDAKSIDSDGSVELSTSAQEEIEKENQQNKQKEIESQSGQKLQTSPETVSSEKPQQNNANLSETGLRSNNIHSPLKSRSETSSDDTSKSVDVSTNLNKNADDTTSVIDAISKTDTQLNDKETVRESGVGSSSSNATESQKTVAETNENHKINRDIHSSVLDTDTSSIPHNDEQQPVTQSISDPSSLPSTSSTVANEQETAKQRLLHVLKARGNGSGRDENKKISPTPLLPKLPKIPPRIASLKSEVATGSGAIGGLRKSNSDHDLAAMALRGGGSVSSVRDIQSQESVSDSELEKSEFSGERMIKVVAAASGNKKNIFDIFKAESNEGCSSS